MRIRCVSDQIDYIDEYIREVKVFTKKHDYWDDMNFLGVECYQLSLEAIYEGMGIMNFGYIKTIESARPPEKVAGNACYDLSYAGEKSITIKPGERLMFSTGLILVFPTNYHGFILPRSGLSWKQGLDVMAGVIDNSFTKETKIILINHSDTPYIINPGDRIAQIELRKDVSFPVVEMRPESVKDVNRDGFGSSGR